MSSVLTYLKEHQSVMAQLETMAASMEEAAQRICAAFQAGGKVLLMGNGGSAADCQHIAAEMVGRFKVERRALPAMALTTDTSILTSLSNDYDYSIIFSRQVDAFCDVKDIVIGISTSGNSKNVIKGITAAKKRGAYTIGLTGASGGELLKQVDLCFSVPSHNVARIQEAHIFIGHTICELIDHQYALETVTPMAAIFDGK